jgi:hypothetical protein
MDLMQAGEQTDGFWRFGTFELNSRTGELRKKGIRIKLQDQPLQVPLIWDHANPMFLRFTRLYWLSGWAA